MDIKLKTIQIKDKSVLMNMFQLYLYDITRFLPSELNNHGLYDYKYIDYYWTEKNYKAYFVLVDRKYAGFVMINDQDFLCLKEKDSYNIAEFFILNKYRKNKTGKKVAHMIFDRFRGNWEVRPVSKSDEAKSFWENTIAEYTDNQYKIEYPIPNRVAIIFNNEDK